MKKVSGKKEKRVRRHVRVRARISGSADRPRMSVFRSNRHVVIQLIDDVNGKTIVSVSDARTSTRGKKEKVAGKAHLAFEAGKRLAERAREKKISRVVFDRGGYKYHGIVQKVAEGAREGGLQF